MTFAGQDNRLNNITVDGSYFNNSFGLSGAPGERTSVAAISLEATEQIQVNVAPYDVRQGNFIGAGVNTVTRSGTNRLTASVYHRFRNEDFVGTEARGLPFNPGTFQYRDTGRLGRRSYREEPPLRLRQLRGRIGHPTADVLHGEQRRPDRWRQHDPRPRVGSQHPELVPLAALPVRNRRLRGVRRRDAGQAVHHPERLQRQQQQQGELPFQLPRFDHGRRHLLVVVARSRAWAGDHQLPELSELELSAESRTSAPGSGSGTRSSAPRCRTISSSATRIRTRAGDRGARSSRWSTSGKAVSSTRRSAPSRSPRTTSCATRPSSCRTTSRGSPTSTRSPSA